MIKHVLLHLYIILKNSLPWKAVAGVPLAVKDFPGLKRCLLLLRRELAKWNILILLQFQTKYMGPGNTFCAHAPGAMEPLQSGLKYFHDDFVKAY